MEEEKGEYETFVLGCVPTPRSSVEASRLGVSLSGRKVQRQEISRVSDHRRALYTI